MDAFDRVSVLEKSTVIRFRTEKGLVDDADFAFISILQNQLLAKQAAQFGRVGASASAGDQQC